MMAGAASRMLVELGTQPATMLRLLRKMEARQLVQHRLEGRTFVYRAVVDEDMVSRRMSGHLLDRLFEGSLADMVREMAGESRAVQAVVDWFGPTDFLQMNPQAGTLGSYDGVKFPCWVGRDGKVLAFTLITNSGNDTRRAVMVIAQNAWRRLGIKVEQ